MASRYVVEGLIATGGMSSVLRAHDRRLGQSVALKVLRRSGDHRDTDAQRFLREGRIVAQLRSDHVVRVLDVDAEGDPPYLAMELLEGSTLAERIAAHGRFPYEVALRVIVQACRGVADAHAIGIIHRDLKPSNLILARVHDGSERVKVIDFGISKPLFRDEAAAPDLTSSGQLLGSPRYMSPEQVRGGAIDPRSDVWALGAILYELLTGSAPFDAPTVADTLARIVGEAPAAVRTRYPEVPEKVESILTLCLSKDPALRPPSVLSLLEELEVVATPGSLSLDGIPEGRLTRAEPATTEADGKIALPKASRKASRPPLALLVLAVASMAVWIGTRWQVETIRTPVPQPSALTATEPPAASPPLVAETKAPAAPPPPTASSVPPLPRPPPRPRALPAHAPPTRDEDLDLARRE